MTFTLAARRELLKYAFQSRKVVLMNLSEGSGGDAGVEKRLVGSVVGRGRRWDG